LQDLRVIEPFIGALDLQQVHMGTLQPFVEARRAQGVKSATVNRTLAVVRQVLNLAGRLWRDEHGLTWLETPPLIRMVDWGDRRDAYPLSVDEQRRLLEHLPAHLQQMALFAVHTGARQEEICGLEWDWEVQIPELKMSVFIVPGSRVKNGEDRVIVLNRVARSIVGTMRDRHPRYVFTYGGHRIGRIYNSGWKRGRTEAGLPGLRVHDLRHTFGRRLRALGVPLETRKVLLGHKNGDITTHYSAPEIEELIDAVERLAEEGVRKMPELTLLQIRAKGANA
jgi:integrase